MTFFEFIVPVIAMAVAGGGYLILRAQVRKRDAGSDRHPAEVRRERLEYRSGIL